MINWLYGKQETQIPHRMEFHVLDSIFNEVLSLIYVLLCPARTRSHLDVDRPMMGNNYYPWSLNFYSSQNRQVEVLQAHLAVPLIYPAIHSFPESCLFDSDDQEDRRRTQPET